MEQEDAMTDRDTAVMQLSEAWGLKLEITAGLPTWEAFPGMRHQKAVRRISQSLMPIPGHPAGCGCFDVADVYIKFPDGSLKRPDIAIYCQEPADTDGATTELPVAVIEVVSQDYELKDLTLNPPFYLGHGVLDVVVVDPRTLAVVHHQAAAVTQHTSPVVLDLSCGCRVTV
jgi:Uma2 family endonuclease